MAEQQANDCKEYKVRWNELSLKLLQEIYPANQNDVNLSYEYGSCNNILPGNANSNGSNAINNLVYFCDVKDEQKFKEVMKTESKKVLHVDCDLNKDEILFKNEDASADDNADTTDNNNNNNNNNSGNGVSAFLVDIALKHFIAALDLLVIYGRGTILFENVCEGCGLQVLIARKMCVAQNITNFMINGKEITEDAKRRIKVGLQNNDHELYAESLEKQELNHIRSYLVSMIISK